MDRQLPQDGEIFLDHIAHFVPRLPEAASSLERLGFHLTPFTAQQNRTPEGMVPAGMANRCVMLRQGYIELLTAVSDTPLARQFHLATSRYVGPHLIAFATADPEAAYATLEGQGFRPTEPVALTRAVEGPQGEALEARFTVLRVPPETMPEGRIQILQHHTEEAVWQERWLGHTNGIVSLKAVMLAVEDPEGAATRFGRFVGRTPTRRDHRWVLDLDRGACVFVAGAALTAVAEWAGEAPALPSIVATALGSADADLTRERFAAGGLPPSSATASGQQIYRLPPELGGLVTVVPETEDADWAS